MKAGDAREGAATAALAAERREYWRVARGAAARVARATALEMDCMLRMRRRTNPRRDLSESRVIFFQSPLPSTPSTDPEKLPKPFPASEGAKEGTVMRVKRDLEMGSPPA